MVVPIRSVKLHKWWTFPIYTFRNGSSKIENQPISINFIPRQFLLLPCLRQVRSSRSIKCRNMINVTRFNKIIFVHWNDQERMFEPAGDRMRREYRKLKTIFEIKLSWGITEKSEINKSLRGLCRVGGIKRGSSRIPVADNRRPEISKILVPDERRRLSWSEVNKSNMKYEFQTVYLPRLPEPGQDRRN